MSNKVIMQLWDKDAVKDELVGSMIFNLKDILHFGEDS
jgi:hypothetical protein